MYYIIVSCIYVCIIGGYVLYNRNWETAKDDENTFTQRVLQFVNGTKLELKKVCLHEAIIHHDEKEKENSNAHELKAEDTMPSSGIHSNVNLDGVTVTGSNSKLLAPLCPKVLIDKWNNSTNTNNTHAEGVTSTSTAEAVSVTTSAAIVTEAISK